jgi:hypothetical protein
LWNETDSTHMWNRLHRDSGNDDEGHENDAPRPERAQTRVGGAQGRTSTWVAEPSVPQCALSGARI